MDHTENTVTQLIQEEHRSKWIARSNHDVKCFTEDEIKKCTNNYETILGRGGFGEVYKGVLEDKSMVAVKRFICNVKENFAKELTVHRAINHKNVVRLVGYCVDENALMVVTEYIPKGNLSNILHDDSTPIALDTRLRIAIECAEALGYMHSKMYTQVIHGDIKPANILLDDGLGAKIADFGISRLVNTENTLYTQSVIGSIGYMDPLFYQSGRLTPKSDVYSFGVMLLELITRKKARDDDGLTGLVERFTQALAKGIRSVREMFDAEIAIPNNIKTIEEVAKLLGKCLKMELHKRPEMLEVAECLCKLRKSSHQGRERPGLFSWGRKNKLARAESTTSQESSSSTENEGTFILGSTMTSSFVLMEDLFRASAEVLGKGTAGVTYKASIESGYTVVKRLRAVDLPKEEFDQRVAVIGAIQNKHIAPLHWYYWSNDEKLLVYNYFPMGSLAHALHVSPALLCWEQRAAIALAAARGVAYIHSAGPSSCHGNIKSSNVMLTGTLDACVSEHGLTTLGLFPGASVYSAPEITDDKWVSQKADVYSFGVLLLELLTRKAPANNTQLEEYGMNLPQWVRSVAQQEWAVKVIDVQLLGQQRKDGEEECMVRLLQLAIYCCIEDANLRPITMSDVVQRIEKMQNKLAPAETAPSQESSSSSHNVGIAAPDESTTSQESSSSTKNVGTFIAGSTMTSSFVLDDLLRASAEVLGKGTVGTTYKGTLESGCTLVVKRLRTVDLPKKEFDLRIAVIGAIQNKHIAPLQWYYCSHDEKMLVYNYFPMGSLASALHGDPVSPAALLSWEQRIAIALAAARGVAYIHSAGPSSCHGNVKSSNVMLTGTHNACVSEHGLTALGPFPGVSGYSPPEITDDKWASQKADVYSFGILLLELLTRKVPVNNTQLEDCVNLPQWVCSVEKYEWAKKVIDVELLEQQQQYEVKECMVRLLQLAIYCCREDADLRTTTMSEVVKRLEKMQNKLAPAETAPSQESSSSSHYVGTAAPDESTTSQESSSSTRNVGTFTVGSTMTSWFVLEDLFLRSAEVLGKGTTGVTYRPTVESGYTVVIKRLRAVDLPEEEFELCLAVIGAIQNKHIAPLQWYYFSNDEKLLVYNFFPRGSLAHALHHHGDPVSPAPLGWDQRLAIALAAARGVAYIHSAGPSSCHGNIKSSNVMLTGTHDACISEHGLAALGPFPGASGYNAPEITDDKWVSQKADVYSFGVLLLELLTGKDPVKHTQLEDGVNLPQWVRSIAQHDWTWKVIDMKLLAEQQKDGEEERMVRFLQLGIHCCIQDANLRTMTMSKIVEQLEKMQN